MAYGFEATQRTRWLSTYFENLKFPYTLNHQADIRQYLMSPNQVELLKKITVHDVACFTAKQKKSPDYDLVTAQLNYHTVPENFLQRYTTVY